VHSDDDIDITWVNLYAPSDFTIFRIMSNGPIEKLLVELGKKIESGLFEIVYNVSASKHALHITVACSKSWDEVAPLIAL
jgi:hypothetical protein